MLKLIFIPRTPTVNGNQFATTVIRNKNDTSSFFTTFHGNNLAKTVTERARSADQQTQHVSCCRRCTSFASSSSSRQNSDQTLTKLL
jgi:hypothetical protein